MSKLNRKEFKALLVEWKSKLINEDIDTGIPFKALTDQHISNKTLYHITNHKPESFENGMTLTAAINKNVKAHSVKQGSGIYFFCKPTDLQKAFSSNNMNYLVVLDIDYKANKDFLPDLEICSGYFVDWFVENKALLYSRGFKSSIIEKVIVKGDPSPFHPGGFPFTAISPKKPAMKILSSYKSYNHFASESGEVVHKILLEIQSFDESQYINCINYIKSNDIAAVKYIGSETLRPSKIYELKNGYLTLVTKVIST